MCLLIGMPGARERRPDRTLLGSRPRAPDGARLGCSTPRTRDGNFDRNADLTMSVDAACAQISGGLLCASLRAAVL